MKIRELLTERADPVSDKALKISAVLSQLKSKLEDEHSQKPLTVKTVLHALEAEDINITVDTFLDMIKKPPLKNLVADANRHSVTFIGHDIDSTDTEALKPEQTTKTLEKMADRAGQRRD